ncbi:MAG: ABC transporter permease subunit [Pseudomonadota bacterium]
MFAFCEDPSLLSSIPWMACYLTTGIHMNFYISFATVLLLLAVTAPTALAFGFAGAAASRSRIPPVAWLGKGYTAIVRGVPDIAFFLFFVIALDQGIEYLVHSLRCADWDEPVRQGANFLVCPQAKVPPSTAAQSWHEAYNFTLAVFTFALVFGAFAANVLYGAMRAVPRAQMETAAAYGMTERQAFWRVLVPQMWIFALPGLSNLWLILIKATPLLFLLGVEDIVYWARELGGSKTARFTEYPHGDWRLYYFLFLMGFYLAFTRVSEIVLARLSVKLSRGQATLGGEDLRKAPA